MVKVVRPEGVIEIYAHREPYPHAGLSYVDIFEDDGARAHLLGRMPPMANEVADAIVEAINGKPKRANATSQRK